ncbi:MAG: type IV secretory system conjugative DNA transfer family protein [Clostridiales bacterium]|nr:type IV secretory system conjugative DNA transfer family protein [Clostridiales bacterium]
MKRNKQKKLDSSYEINQSGKQLLGEHRIISNKKILLPFLGLVSLVFFFLCNYLFQMILQIPRISHTSEIPFDPGIGNAFVFQSNYWIFYVVLAAVALFFDLRILYMVRTNFKDFNVNQKGSERFATLEEIQKQYKEIPEKDYPYPGKPGALICRYRDKIYIDDSPVNNLIIGMTRSGKGETYVFPSIDIYSRAQKKSSMIIVDPKLELIKSSYQTLKKRGYEIHILNLTNPSDSMGFNPLQLVIDAYKRKEYAEAELLCSSFCFSIFNPDAGDGDSQFWSNNSTALLTALILAHVEDCLKADQKANELAEQKFLEKQQAFHRLTPEEKEQVRNNWGAAMEKQYALPEQVFVPSHENEKKINMYSIINTFSILANQQVNETQTALDRYFSCRDDLDRAKLKYSAIGIAGDRTKGSIFSNTFSKLTVFTYENIAKMTAESSVNLEDIGFGEKPIAVFLSIPDYDRSNHFIASVFIRQLYFVLAKKATESMSGKCTREVIFLLDEFGNIPAIESMANIITVCLGRNIRFNLIIQSYSQLDQLYGDDSQTIIGNCGNKIYIKTDDLGTARDFSELLGNRTAINANRSGKVLSMEKTLTEMYEERALLTVNELMRLRQGECVVKRSMKQSDLHGTPITAYPIFNTGKTAFKYRFEYLTDTFPNPDSIDFEKLKKDEKLENTSDIEMEKRVFDPKARLAELEKEQAEKEAREQAKAQETPSNPPLEPSEPEKEEPGDPLDDTPLADLPGFQLLCGACRQNGIEEDFSHMTLGELTHLVEEKVRNYTISADCYCFLMDAMKKEKQKLEPGSEGMDD